MVVIPFAGHAVTLVAGLDEDRAVAGEHPARDDDFAVAEHGRWEEGVDAGCLRGGWSLSENGSSCCWQGAK